MSFLDATPKTSPSTPSKGKSFPFYLQYGTKKKITILNSMEDEEPIQYIKFHQVPVTGEDGKTQTQKVLCLNYKSDSEEDSGCPMCDHYGDLIQEGEKPDWKTGLKAKQALPMSILSEETDKEGNIKEYRKVRFSNSYDQKFIAEKLADYKAETGEDLDIRGLVFMASRAEEPESGPKPAGVGELELLLTGFKTRDLSGDDTAIPFTMEEILQDHFIHEESEIKNIMSPYM